MNMKILGIDYGKKRIGTAVSDENRKMAFPREVLLNNETLLDNLKSLIEKEDVSLIVIGESKDFKMNDNPIMKDINKFKELLGKEFNLEVVLHPEVLSSHQAAKMMGESNEKIDASSATIILQSYLDYKLK
jgi:putative holliday junction resolvase